MDSPGARRSAVALAARILALVAAACALWLAREVLLLGFVGVLLAVVFSFPVGWLQRFMPRGTAVLVVLAALLGATALLGWGAAATLSKEVQELRSTLPQTLQKARQLLLRVESQTGGGGAAQGGGAQMQKAGELALPAVGGLFGGLTALVLVVVLGLFLVHEPGAYIAGVRRLVPREHEAVFDEALRRAGGGLRRWVGGILVSMTIMGVLCGAGLALAGVKEWLLLGVLTFLGTFVPYVGALASAVPGLLAALGQSGHTFLLAGLVYLGVHVVEGYLVEPFVMKRAVEIRPALLLFVQGLFGAVFGLMGTVVATPMLVCAQELVQYLWVERRLGKGER